MNYSDRTPEGLFRTAQFIASQQTPFRVYIRAVGALGLSVCLLFSTFGISKLWQSYPAHAQPAPVIEEQKLQKYSPGLLARIQQEVPEDVDQPAPIPAPVSKPVASAPAVNLAPAESLDEVIARWKAAHPGIRLGVAVRELDGQGRQAGFASDRLFYSASLYKLYTVLYLYDRIENAGLDPSSSIGSSRSVQTCIDAMILSSDNECGQSIGNAVGWNTIEQVIRAKGFSGTMSTGGIRTSAGDMVEYLTRLESGQLMNQEHTAHLIDLMKNQIYRQAIPAGISGTVVADKVGFYNGYWHDAGIVYGPKSKYALTIMTQGGGAASIANLASQIAEFLNR